MPRTGINAQIGYAKETTHGVHVTPSLFLPLVSESLTTERERLESDGIIAGRHLLTSGQWSVGNVTAGGDVQHELYDRDLEVLLEAMFGGKDEDPSDGDVAYFPGNLGSLTVQKGVPGVAGVVHPLTYPGSTVASWEIGFSAGAIATLGISFSSKLEIGHRTVSDGVTTDEDATVTSATAVFSADDVGKPISGTGIPAATTIASINSATSVEMSAAANATGTSIAFVIGVALESASYTAGIRPLTFVDGSVSVAGTPVRVRQGTLSGDNGVDTDRRFVGDRYRDAPLPTDLRTYDGSLELEFTDHTHYNRFCRGTEHAMVLQFMAGALGVKATANVRYDGETPAVGDRGIVANNVPFKCVASGADTTALTVAIFDGS